jgi:two-component system, OmpR family, sensor histidine kinase MprB
MSFRLRLTVLAALAVAVALVGASFVVYYTDRGELIGQIDSDLSASQDVPRLNTVLGVVQTRGIRVRYAQGTTRARSVLTARQAVPPGAGNVRAVGTAHPTVPPFFNVVLPRSSAAARVRVALRKPGISFRKTPPRFSTETIKGVPTRVLTLVLPNGTVTISRSLVEVDRNLDHLRWLLVFICLGGVVAAALLGALVSRTAVAPLRRLTERTERIVETGDLSERIGHRGRDEISRLSARLDELLATLEASMRTQRQLVADASHELRTPIATLRANFELLGDPGALDVNDRAELAADVRDELESITMLVGELVELARGEEFDVAPSDFRLDEVVQVAVDRAARRAPNLSFRTRLEPSVVRGVPERVERAVANLLDNARKWSPASEIVDVAVHDGLVEVRDRGPGIAAEDLPLVFNRFYRSAKARGMPGAGLGLAIVKQIADAHGGSVTVDQAPGGGAILRLRLSSTR